VTLDDLLDNMRGALRLLLAHLNGLRPHQWDWTPSLACRSIRDILLHMSEIFEGKDDLVRELSTPVPDVARVQALFEAAAEGDYERLRLRYLETPLDTDMVVEGSDFFLGREQVRAGTLLARRAWEECYHAGQVVYIRLATDPDWDQEGEVYGIGVG
jgi:hypothetical protein